MTTKNYGMIFWLCFLIVHFALPGHADNSKIQKIDELMSFSYKNGLFNGTILVAENGNIIYDKAFGYADFTTKEMLKVNSPFYLGSISKQFTTMAIMILKEQNKLSCSDKLSDYFPEFPDYANDVTIQHLMTHTSGIPDHYQLNIYKPGLTNQNVLEVLIKQDKLDFKPGERYSYSNGAYVLLSMIVAKASGMPFHDFMKLYIFDPLEMNQTLVYDESEPAVPYRAVGFNKFGKLNDYNIFTTGAGGIYSTTADLFKWDKALYTERLIKQEILNEAFTPFVLNNDSTTDYGYGWTIREDETGKTVSHSGGLVGYRTYIERQLSKHNTMIMLTNKGNSFQMVAIRRAIRNILNDKPYKLPQIPISLEMQTILHKHDISAAVQRYHAIKESEANKYLFSEEELNSLGYYCLQNKMVEEAIAILKLNVEAYPDAFNTYDSLAEAYMTNDEYDLAIKYYMKSFQLNTDNKNAVEMIKKIQTMQKINTEPENRN